jgi:hypothetical protein
VGGRSPPAARPSKPVGQAPGARARPGCPHKPAQGGPTWPIWCTIFPIWKHNSMIQRINNLFFIPVPVLFVLNHDIHLLPP